MDLSAIRTRVYDALEQETDGTSMRWPQVTIDQIINDGNRDMTVRAGCKVGFSTLIPVANQLVYDLPSDIVRLLRLYRTDVQEKVWPIGLSELDRNRPTWQTSSGTRLEWYFLLGMDKLVTGPFLTTVTNEAYEITYSQDPGVTAMASDNDTPTVPRKFHASLVDYTVGRALMVDAAGSELETAQRFVGDYQQSVLKLRRLVFEHLDRRHALRAQDMERADVDGSAIGLEI